MKNDQLIQDLKHLLLEGEAATQETLCTTLMAQGHPINQPKISRLLKKLNAIKSKNNQGEMVYCLNHDAAPPKIDSSLAGLVINILHNESMIVIKTSPGSASLIARIMDNKKCHVLGTIAGDDTIFIAPESIETLQETLGLIHDFLDFRRLS